MRSGSKSYWKSETSIEEIIEFEARFQAAAAPAGIAALRFIHFDQQKVVRIPRRAVP
jgi:hypothetical protein